MSPTRLTPAPEKMPTSIAEIYELITGECVEIRSKLNLFNELFRKSQERMDFLASHAGYFFAYLRSTILQDLVLAFSRITDPASMGSRGKYQNVSLDQLHKRARQAGGLDEDSERELGKLLTEIDEVQSRLISPIRDKFVAHYDCGYVLGYEAKEVPNVTPDDLLKQLERVEAFTHALRRFYDLSTISFSGAPYDHDVVALVHCLSKVNAYEELEKAGHIPRHTFWNYEI